MKNFHEKFYCAENLYLVVTGMVEPQQVLETVNAFEKKIVGKVCRSYLSLSVIIPSYVVWAGCFVYCLFVFHYFIMYDYGFLSRGSTDRREILHGGLAIFQTGLLLFWRGIAPRTAEF